MRMRGKRDWPALLAELSKARGDTARQQELIRNEGAVLLASRWAGSFYKPFTAPGYTLYYSQYKDVLPADQLERIRNMVRHDGWSYLMRVDHRMDPLYRRTEFNSENFNWMARMAGVFWSHEFDDREKQRYFDSYLDNLVRALYAAGRVEWNSSLSWGDMFQAALVLYESAHDTKVKDQARAILDWMTVEAALHYFDGRQSGPEVRAAAAAYRAFAGSGMAVRIFVLHGWRASGSVQRRGGGGAIRRGRGGLRAVRILSPAARGDRDRAAKVSDAGGDPIGQTVLRV